MSIYWPSDLVVKHNKYFTTYNVLMTLAQSRFLPVSPYMEKHHAIPDSFFIHRSRKGNPGWLSGDPNSVCNVVYLTPKEHYIAHRLLCKFLTGPALRKMVYALRAMGIKSQTNNKRYVYPSRVYSQIVEQERLLRRGTPLGKLSKPRKAHSAESNLKRSLKLKGRRRLDMVGKPSWNAGKKLTEGQRAALKGPRGPMSEENKAIRRGPRGPLKSPRIGKPRGPYKKRPITQM